MGAIVSVLALPHQCKLPGATAKSTILQMGTFACTGSVIRQSGSSYLLSFGLCV